MQKQGTNRFAGVDFGDDSDDLDMKVQQTKTQKKKEERKITEKVASKAPKVNATKMAEGGFEVQTDQRGGNAPARGRGGGDRGRGGADRGRGGRGGRGRGGADGERQRPRTAAPRLDADGNPINVFCIFHSSGLI